MVSHLLNSSSGVLNWRTNACFIPSMYLRTAAFQSFVNVKLFLGETFQFSGCFVGATEHVELEEWLWVHDVGLVKVREEPVADAVGKNTEMGVGDAEVADELRDGIFGKVAAVLFALNQYGRLAALHYGVVNLLAPLYPNAVNSGTTSAGSKMSYPR